MIELEKDLSQKIIYQDNKTEENNDSTLKKSTNTASSIKTNSEIKEDKQKFEKDNEKEKIHPTKEIDSNKSAIIYKNLLIPAKSQNKLYIFNSYEKPPIIKNQSILVENDMIHTPLNYDINFNSKIYISQKDNIFCKQKIEKNHVNVKLKFFSIFSLNIRNNNYSINFKAKIINNKFELSINISKYKNNFRSYFLKNLLIFKDFKINPLELISSRNKYSNQPDLESKICFNFPKKNKYFKMLKYELNKAFNNFYKQGYNTLKILNNLYNKVKQIIFSIENYKKYKFNTLRNREYSMLVEEQNKNTMKNNEDYSALIMEYEYKVEIEHINEIGFYNNFIEFCQQ